MKTNKIILSLLFIFSMTLTVNTVSAAEKSTSVALNCITGDELTRNGETDLVRALRGKVAGMNILSTASFSNSSISMSGMSSLTSPQQPLFIVDGMSVESLDIVNIHDVEMVQVLKNNEATAIYGSRGANGVIVVTTKR